MENKARQVKHIYAHSKEKVNSQIIQNNKIKNQNKQELKNNQRKQMEKQIVSNQSLILYQKKQVSKGLSFEEIEQDILKNFEESLFKEVQDEEDNIYLGEEAYDGAIFDSTCSLNKEAYIINVEPTQHNKPLDQNYPKLQEFREENKQTQALDSHKYNQDVDNQYNFSFSELKIRDQITNQKIQNKRQQQKEKQPSDPEKEVKFDMFQSQQKDKIPSLKFSKSPEQRTGLKIQIFQNYYKKIHEKYKQPQINKLDNLLQCKQTQEANQDSEEYYQGFFEAILKAENSEDLRNILQSTQESNENMLWRGFLE